MPELSCKIWKEACELFVIIQGLLSTYSTILQRNKLQSLWRVGGIIGKVTEGELMLLSSFVILQSPESSSFPGLGSQMLHTGKGHSMGDRILSSVTASHFPAGLMNYFQFLEEPENSTVSLLSAT